LLSGSFLSDVIPEVEHSAVCGIRSSARFSRIAVLFSKSISSTL
jgi:hypothetical protein